MSIVFRNHHGCELSQSHLAQEGLKQSAVVRVDVDLQNVHLALHRAVFFLVISRENMDDFYGSVHQMVYNGKMFFLGGSHKLSWLIPPISGVYGSFNHS